MSQHFSQTWCGSWHKAISLKTYGYGDRLADAPPIVSQRVKGNRIEYERAENFAVRLSDFGLQEESIFTRQDEIRNPRFVEWYEHRAEGLTQGFMIDVRPRREASARDEPLRLVLSLHGDLRAEVTNDSQAIELTDLAGKRTLSYGELTALDAGKKHLPTHKETSADGIDITLVVDDRTACYPIVIDVIVTSLEKRFDARNSPETEAQNHTKDIGTDIAVRTRNNYAFISE